REGGERHQLGADGEPVQYRLLQRCRAAKLLREQLANAVEKRIAHRQKGSHIAAEQLVNRFGNQLECQGIAAVEARERTHLGCRRGDVLGLKDDPAGVVVETSELQRAHRRRAAFQRAKLGGLLAAAQQHTALVLALAQCVQQRTILGVAAAIGATQRSGLQYRFEIVENEQAAPLAKELNEQPDLVV